jgi:hypothetical protein
MLSSPSRTSSQRPRAEAKTESGYYFTKGADGDRLELAEACCDPKNNRAPAPINRPKPTRRSVQASFFTSARVIATSFADALLRQARLAGGRSIAYPDTLLDELGGLKFSSHVSMGCLPV